MSQGCFRWQELPDGMTVTHWECVQGSSLVSLRCRAEPHPPWTGVGRAPGAVTDAPWPVFGTPPSRLWACFLICELGAGTVWPPPQAASTAPSVCLSSHNPCVCVPVSPSYKDTGLADQSLPR